MTEGVLSRGGAHDPQLRPEPVDRDRVADVQAGVQGGAADDDAVGAAQPRTPADLGGEERLRRHPEQREVDVHAPVALGVDERVAVGGRLRHTRPVPPGVHGGHLHHAPGEGGVVLDAALERERGDRQVLQPGHPVPDQTHRQPGQHDHEDRDQPHDGPHQPEPDLGEPQLANGEEHQPHTRFFIDVMSTKYQHGVANFPRVPRLLRRAGLGEPTDRRPSSSRSGRMSRCRAFGSCALSWTTTTARRARRDVTRRPATHATQ